MVVVAPFGTAELDFWDRVIFWAINLSAIGFYMHVFVHAGVHSTILRPLPHPIRMFLGAICAGVPAGAVVVFLFLTLGDQEDYTSQFADLWIQLSIWGWVVFVLEYHVWPMVFGPDTVTDIPEGTAEVPQAAAAAPPPAADGQPAPAPASLPEAAPGAPAPVAPAAPPESGPPTAAPAGGPTAAPPAPSANGLDPAPSAANGNDARLNGRSRLASRLPAELQTEHIESLSMQDHYVEVVTAKGSHLLLMRLKDAIDLLDGTPGSQIHRSHWVSQEAIDAIERDGRRHRAVLRDGRELPISQSYLSDARTLLE